jgi:hypothetical protein
MTPAPDGRGPEPLRDEVVIVVLYALLAATTLAYALAPVSDDLGPAQALALTILLTPLALAAIRWRAHDRSQTYHRAPAEPPGRDRGATPRAERAHCPTPVNPRAQPDHAGRRVSGSSARPHAPGARPRDERRRSSA